MSSRRPASVPSNSEKNRAPAEGDPSIFFAAERTLLAWLRTGLTIMALGFVVSRFGLFMRLMAAESRDKTATADAAPLMTASAALGAAFVVVGTLAILVSAYQHHRFVRTLRAEDLPQEYSKAFVLALTLVVGVLGLILSGYLLLVHT